MRCPAAMFVFALLLPTVPTGGHLAAAEPAPLDLFGGDGTRGGEAPLVAEVYYRALRADEYVVIANPSPTPVDLSGWTITDGEGTLTFPANATAPAEGRVVVAQNATAYGEDTLRPADFTYGGGNATPMLRSRTFLLANAGDEVLLRDPSGTTVDAFVYGTSAYAGSGWTGPAAKCVGAGFVARRAFTVAWQDTDSALDWDLVRVWSLGQSEFAPDAFDVIGTVRAFVTPDATAAPLIALLANATATVDLSLYTLTSEGLVDALAAAGERGVRVRLLLEGDPVGGIDEEEWALVHRLPAADVRFLVGNVTADIQERYRYVHAKYAVLDGATVVVGSENWGRSAFPEANETGSRGWVVAVPHAPLAAYFERVFEEDFDARRRDVRPLADMSVVPVPPDPWVPAPRPVDFPPVSVTGTFRVVPVLGPDTALADATILGAIRGATRTVHAEVFYADRTWGPFPDLYLEALIDAARRGVEVRLLLDSSDYNTDDGDRNDNDDTAAYANGVAAAEGLDLEARLIDRGAHGLLRAHTKGFVVDGETVLVSSVNWGRNSATGNREAGLLVTNADLAAYFEEAFAWDWRTDFTPPRADAGPDRTVRVGDTVAFSGLGSTDEEEVVNWSWDTDGDGAFDRWGAEVSATYGGPGAVTVRLRATDAAGNAGDDTATVTVLAAAEEAGTPLVALAVVGCAALAILLVALLRRRRQRLSKPP